MVSPGIEFICPNCGKRTVVLTLEELPCRPFCSPRCKMVDLYRWMNEEIVLSEPISPTGKMPIVEDVPDEE
jgi:endogenous inhibitor of DNA gyrase (YacG/DUF329 family)